MKKIGVVLSGCGVYDGSEIHESVLTILAINKLGAEPVFLSLNKDQAHVINHQQGEPEKGEARNMMTEAARIARGPVQDLRDVNIDELDAIVFPGGFGAAKNFSNFAFEGKNMTVDPDIETFITNCHSAKKPLGFICISPVLAAKVIPNVKVTIGSDQVTAEAITSFGAEHEISTVTNVVVDETNLVVSTPAYMCDAGLHDIQTGIEALVTNVLKLSHTAIVA